MLRYNLGSHLHQVDVLTDWGSTMRWARPLLLLRLHIPEREDALLTKDWGRKQRHVSLGQTTGVWWVDCDMTRRPM